MPLLNSLLHELDKQAPFADEIMPADELFISHYADTPSEHTHELQLFLSTKRASPQPGSGGCDNHSFVSALCGASKTVPLPLTMKLVLMEQIEEAKELYWAKGPKDV